MSIFWFITTLLLLHSCTPGVGMDHGIVNGKESIPHSRPYMVYILDKQAGAACDGFLIREDFVLTAAHCKTKHGQLMVYLGVDDTNDLPEGIEVDAFPHESFENKPGDDIMLLKLKTPATLSKTVNIIALPETREKISSNCMAMGWGWKEYNKMTPSRVLREVNLTLLDSENCATPHTLCTKEEAGPAQGDSGGPLICGNVPQGIVSYYIKNEFTSYLTMYTKISHYLPWIHNKIMNAPL